ncbi:hypothetical protein MKX01_016742, partial [Papaver californicum]
MHNSKTSFKAMHDYDDDDDGPKIFKRRKTTTSSSNVNSKHDGRLKMMTTITTSDSGMVPWSVLPSVSNKPKQSSVGRDSRFRYIMEEKSKLMNEDKMNLTSLFRLSSAIDEFTPQFRCWKKGTTFARNGILLPPPYKPHGVKMLYNGKHVELSPEREEVATMFAFIDNFMKDWRVILGKEHVIKEFHLRALKEEKLKHEERYIVEPPELFRGSGEYPKMGKLKRRIRPNKITINIRKGELIPEYPMKQQIVVAAYLIYMLALRAGNEKDGDEDDIVVPQTNKLKINFLGKYSIKYDNTVKVDPLVYKAELFDKLDTYKLNAYLKELMPGLTTKVFRTYDASITLDKLLNSEIMGGNIAEKVVVYNRANKEVAKLCNHQQNIFKLKGVLDGLETVLIRVRKGKAPLQLDIDDGKSKEEFYPQ